MTTATDLRSLHGRVVLVKSAQDHRHPPTAMRGWIAVHEGNDAQPEASIELEFPQMFRVPAHHRTVRLDAAALERLLACDAGGAFEFTLDELDAPAANTATWRASRIP